LPDVLDDAAQESGEGGYFARAEQGEGVVLDGGGPVGGVRVEGMKEMILDPV
jgi:hypothetical protein